MIIKFYLGNAYVVKQEELLVSFNEGLTPLVSTNFSGCKLRIKMEGSMPTGSFKDRGSVMVINYLLKNNIKQITEDSSGNAGASVAGYCALGNIPCDIFVPKGNSSEKLNQIKAFGANIHEVAGSREDVAAEAQKDALSYAGHNWHPLFIQGTKSIAYELWEQNNYESPKNIVTVAGNGSLVLGIYEGFKELMYNKLVSELPRLFVVQSINCNPIYRLFYNLPPIEKCNPTIAEGISLARPNKAEKIVEAIKNTGGSMIEVSENEIIRSLKFLGSNGFYVEPTSSAAYAGLEKLIEDGVISVDDEVIMVITGNGLKASSSIANLITKE